MVPLSEAKHEFLNYLVSIERSPETVNGYRKDLKTFIRHIESKYNGVVYIDEVTSADIQHYMMYLKQERRLTAVSRNRYLSSIRSLYNFAVKREWVDRNVAAIVEQVKVQRKERTHLTRDELYKLFDAIKHPIIKVAVVFLSYTGLRISEAMNLTFDNVDLERKLMFIKGKGEKLRVVPISDRLYPILINYLEEVREADSDRLFATKKNGEAFSAICERSA